MHKIVNFKIEYQIKNIQNKEAQNLKVKRKYISWKNKILRNWKWKVLILIIITLLIQAILYQSIKVKPIMSEC